MSQDELMHYGKRGMRWGQRKMAPDSTPKAPTYSRATTGLILSGSTVLGNKKNRYTDPAALAQRTKAGQQFADSFTFGVGAASAKVAVSSIMKSSSLSAGKKAAAALVLGTAAGALSAASAVNAAKGTWNAYGSTRKEKLARKK